MTEQSSEKQPHHEDYVPEDDAVIGQAFKWSIIVFALLGMIAAVVAWQMSSEDDPDTLTNIVVTPPEVPVAVATPPRVAFTDVTAQCGIDFVHHNGAAGDKLLPETMGSGLALFDYNNDGAIDILFVNACDWPDIVNDTPPTQRLYRNDGAGRFTDVTVDAGVGLVLYGTGVAVGDVDNDGDADLFIAALGRNRLLINTDGRFSDATDRAGVGGADDAWSTCSGFLDYDHDGDLDLFVGNYVEWSREIDFAVDYRLVGVGRAYGPPMNFKGTNSYLYRNNGDGTFDDVSATAGIEVSHAATGAPVGKALGVAIVDVDGDGLLDLVVANDTVRNFLFRNRGDGTFEEIGALAGLAYNGMGNATGAMGIDAAEFRNDGHLGFAIGNFANEMTSLYCAGADALQYTDVAIIEGLGAPSRQALSFGVFFFDYDLDGRLDVLQCNGHLEDEINTVQPSQFYRQPAQLFWNAGPEQRATFIEVPRELIGALGQPIVGRGAACADLDNDGDLDIVVTQTGGPPVIVRNDQATGHHWLRLRLVGRRQRDAIGAVAELVAGDMTQRRVVMPTRSYLAQFEMALTFGLGTVDTIESLKITWPDGSTQSIDVPGVDRLIVVEQVDQ